MVVCVCVCAHVQLLPAAPVLQHAQWPGSGAHRRHCVWDCAGPPGYSAPDREKSVQPEAEAALWTPRWVRCSSESIIVILAWLFFLYYYYFCVCSTQTRSWKETQRRSAVMQVPQSCTSKIKPTSRTRGKSEDCLSLYCHYLLLSMVSTLVFCHQALEIRVREEQRMMDKKIVAEIDQKVIDQQNTLEKAGVPGFYITTNPQVGLRTCSLSTAKVHSKIMNTIAGSSLCDGDECPADGDVCPQWPSTTVRFRSWRCRWTCLNWSSSFSRRSPNLESFEVDDKPNLIEPIGADDVHSHSNCCETDCASVTVWHCCLSKATSWA